MSVEYLLQRFSNGQPMTILDLGCGKGTLVAWLKEQGHDAYGCDIAGSKASEFSPDSTASSNLRAIQLQPYRLPFADCQFDCVLSSQVLEHVADYRSTFDEIQRVLKTGGISLHAFPPRHVLIEPHVFVPLASLIRSRAWLLLWALLGVRNQYQIGKTFWEVARLNYDYLHTHTNYLSKSQILQYASHFSEAGFREDVFFTPGKAEKLQQSLKKRIFVQLGGDKLRIWLHGTFVMRALYLKK